VCTTPAPATCINAYATTPTGTPLPAGCTAPTINAACLPAPTTGCGVCSNYPIARIMPTCNPTTVTTSAMSDPHLALAHGGRADFKGEHNAWYSMLSARNVSFNVNFQHDDFKNVYKLVHGSAMKSAAWVLRTNVTGTIVTVEYNATAGSATRALVRVAGNEAGQWVAHGGRAFKLENVKVELKEKKLSGAGVNAKGKAWHGTALIVTSGNWQTNVWSKPYPNAAANPGKALLNIQLEPLYDADSDPVAPHGIIGQSWDGDDAPADGLLDDYSASEVTTQAMGEGAIEGKAADYRLKHKFATLFKFSRFDATSARHRDASKIERPQRKSAAKPVEAIERGVGAVSDVVEADEVWQRF